MSLYKNDLNDFNAVAFSVSIIQSDVVVQWLENAAFYCKIFGVDWNPGQGI